MANSNLTECTCARRITIGASRNRFPGRNRRAVSGGRRRRTYRGRDRHRRCERRRRRITTRCSWQWNSAVGTTRTFRSTGTVRRSCWSTRKRLCVRAPRTPVQLGNSQGVQDAVSAAGANAVDIEDEHGVAAGVPSGEGVHGSAGFANDGARIVAAQRWAGLADSPVSVDGMAVWAAVRVACFVTLSSVLFVAERSRPECREWRRRRGRGPRGCSRVAHVCRGRRARKLRRQ